jgi:hypothetical protein
MSDASSPKVGLVRCPFCKELLEFERASWVACAGCLVRHHASCWTEGGACATCGDPRALSLVATPAKPRRSRFGVALGASLLVAVPAALTAWFVSAQSALIRAQAARLDDQADRIEREAEATRLHVDVSIKNLAELVDTKTVQIKNQLQGFKPHVYETPDELTERLDRLERGQQRVVDRVEREIKQVDAHVASLPRQVTVVAALGEKPGKAAALDALAQARKDGLFRGDYDAAKEALLSGKLSPANALELRELARLRNEHTISSSEFETMKKELIEK